MLNKFKEEEFLIKINEKDNFINFNEELSCFLYEHLEDKDDLDLITFVYYLKDIFERIFNIFDDKKLEFIIFNLSQILLTNLTYFKRLFFDFWKILIINEVSLSEIEIEINKYQLFHEIFEKIVTFYSDKDMMKIFEMFNTEFIKVIIDQINKKNSKDLIKCALQLLPLYENIQLVVKFYFKEFNYINKDGRIFSSIISFFDEIIEKDSIENASLIELLNKKEYDIILKILRISIYSPKVLNYFMQILLKSIKHTFKNSYDDYETTKNCLKLFELFNEFEVVIFNEENKNFFNLSENYTEFRKIISDTLNLKNEKARIICEFFDFSIRHNRNDIRTWLYSYLDLLEEYSEFEKFYIYQIIDRVMDGFFNKALETEIIDNIFNNKNIFKNSFILKTAINNIKICNNEKIIFVGIPAHCYHFINMSCKPVISDKIIISLFEKHILEFKFPLNSKLMIQQGSIEFYFRKFPNLKLKANILQYLILHYISTNKKKQEIYDYFQISKELLDYCLEKLLDNQLVEFENDNLFINKKFPFINQNYINLECNLIEFTYKSKYISQFREKDINNVIDCYIMKFIKKAKSADTNNVLAEISKITFHKINNLENKRILTRLEYLVDKSLIRKENNLFIY